VDILKEKIVMLKIVKKDRNLLIFTMNFPFLSIAKEYTENTKKKSYGFL